MTKKQRIWNGKNGLAMLNDLRNALIRELDVLFVIKTPISNVGRTRLTLLFAEDVKSREAREGMDELRCKS